MDDEELLSEFEQLQQEELDAQMLNTGNVPVTDDVHKISAPTTERENETFPTSNSVENTILCQ